MGKIITSLLYCNPKEENSKNIKKSIFSAYIWDEALFWRPFGYDMSQRNAATSLRNLLSLIVPPPPILRFIAKNVLIVILPRISFNFESKIQKTLTALNSMPFKNSNSCILIIQKNLVSNETSF